MAHDEGPNENLPRQWQGASPWQACSMTASRSCNSPCPASSRALGLAPTPRKLNRSARQPHSTKARAKVCTTLFSAVPPNSGWGGRSPPRPQPVHEAGRSSRTSMAPTGQAEDSVGFANSRNCYTIYSYQGIFPQEPPAEFCPPRSTPQMRRREQTRDHLAILQVRLDDFVNIVLVRRSCAKCPPGTPQPLGRPHSDPDTRLVHPHLAGASQIPAA